MGKTIEFSALWRDSIQLVKERIKAILALGFIFNIAIFVVIVGLSTLFFSAMLPILYDLARLGEESYVMYNILYQLEGQITALLFGMFLIFFISALLSLFYMIAVFVVITKRDQEDFQSITTVSGDLFMPFFIMSLIFVLFNIVLLGVNMLILFYLPSLTTAIVVFVVPIIVMIFLSIRFSLIWSILTLGVTRDPVKALRMSFHMTQGKSTHILLVLISWYLANFLAILILCGVVFVLIWALSQISFFLSAVFMFLQFFLFIALAAVFLGLLFALLTNIYWQLSERDQVEDILA